MKRFILSIVSALALSSGALASTEGEQHITDHDWSFEGFFGSYDTFQLQRGLQVFTEVCSACHGIKYVGFYALDDEGGPHLPENQARAYAKNFYVWDEANREEREASYSDHFPAVTSAGAPDLSLMAKARAGFHGPYNLGINQLLNGIGGPEYIYSVLTGYTGHEIEEAGVVFYENEAFAGNKISMAPPLSDGLVDYAQEDIPETVEQYAADVTAFLMWVAEPKLDARKQGGLLWFIMLSFITGALYLGNKLLWYPIKHKDDE